LYFESAMNNDGHKGPEKAQRPPGEGAKNALFIALLIIVSALAGGVAVHFFYRVRLSDLHKKHEKEMALMEKNLWDERSRSMQKELSGNEIIEEIEKLKQKNERLEKEAARLEKNKEYFAEESERRLTELRRLQSRLLRPDKPHASIKPLLEHEKLLKESFPEWFALWKEMVPGFRLDVFIWHRRDKMEDLSWPLYEEGVPRSHVEEKLENCIFSPDGSKCVSPYWCWGEVDSCVMVVDIDMERLRRVSFCGTPCRFDDAVWLDNSRFAVAGAHNEYSGKNRVKWFAEMSVYDLDTGKVTSYQGPPATHEDFQKRYAEFHKEMRKKKGMDF